MQCVVHKTKILFTRIYLGNNLWHVVREFCLGVFPTNGKDLAILGLSVDELFLNPIRGLGTII